MFAATADAEATMMTATIADHRTGGECGLALVRPSRPPGRPASARSRPRRARRDGAQSRSSCSPSDGFRDLLLTPSLLLLLAIGQAIVIITRNVDLSVGSVLGLTAYLTGRLFIDVPGIPMIAVFVGGIAARRPCSA